MVFGQLTDRQKHVYEFIHDKITNRGYGPTVREIGEEFNISSPNGVMCHLKALEKKGAARRLAEPNLTALSGETASLNTSASFSDFR